MTLGNIFQAFNLKLSLKGKNLEEKKKIFKLQNISHMESKPSIKGEFPKVNSVPATFPPPHLIFTEYLW